MIKRGYGSTSRGLQGAMGRPRGVSGDPDLWHWGLADLLNDQMDATRSLPIRLNPYKHSFWANIKGTKCDPCIQKDYEVNFRGLLCPSLWH